MKALTTIFVTLLAMSAYAEDVLLSSYDFVMLDIGLQPGSVDMHDVVMDINKSCDTDEYYLVGGGVNFDVMTLASLDYQLQNIDSHTIASHFGFPFSSSADPQHFNEHIFIPKYADYGSDSLFVLLPEVHPYSLPPQIAEKNMIIEIKRSIIAIQWIMDLASKGESVLNLSEGIAGLSARLDWFESSGDPFDDIFTLAGNNPYTILYNIYPNSNFILSTKVEEPFYLLIDSILFDGYKPGDSFDEVLARMTPEDGLIIDPLAIPMVREAYDRIQMWDQATFDRWEQSICEFRSEKIAESAIQRARETNPKLVFLTFGMAHTGGIVRVLEQSQISYIILQANSKELD